MKWFDHAILRKVAAISGVTIPAFMAHLWTGANVRSLVLAGVICAAITMAHAATLFLMLDTINSMERNRERNRR